MESCCTRTGEKRHRKQWGEQLRFPALDQPGRGSAVTVPHLTLTPRNLRIIPQKTSTATRSTKWNPQSCSGCLYSDPCSICTDSHNNASTSKTSRWLRSSNHRNRGKGRFFHLSCKQDVVFLSLLNPIKDSGIVHHWDAFRVRILLLCVYVIRILFGICDGGK